MSETEYISKQLKLLDSVDHEISSLHDTNSRLVQIRKDVQGYIVECAHSRNELTAENAKMREALKALREIYSKIFDENDFDLIDQALAAEGGSK